MIKFWKKYSNYFFFGALLLILLVPQIRFPVQVFLQRLFSFSPTEIAEEKREELADYNWLLESHEGDDLDFNQFKGEVIIINFWATWCPPCVAEMPDFQDLYNEYKGEVKFLFVSNDPVSKVQRFALENQYDLPFYTPKSVEPSKLNYSALPTTFIISKDQKIIMRKEGAAKWNGSAVRGTIDDLLVAK
jgi:thiol-disulfide isomerase/thioredoxin